MVEILPEAIRSQFPPGTPLIKIIRAKVYEGRPGTFKGKKHTKATLEKMSRSQKMRKSNG